MESWSKAGVKKNGKEKMNSKSAPMVSIIIKALNEEELIGRCIESALRELEGLNGEVIVADSLSSDRTVEIAGRYPVRVVQLMHTKDRGAGAAAQLGYQHSHGQFIYILDGDMELLPGFLRRALSEMRNDQSIAGVGGLLQDSRVNNAFDRYRVKNKPSAEPGFVPWLNGGGLYRRQAIERVGYLAHRFLPAYEEAELGMRLRAAGFHLLRLPVPAVSHTGHDEKTLGMILRMWRNGYIAAGGMLFKSAIGKTHLGLVIRNQAISILMIAWFVLLISSILVSVSVGLMWVMLAVCIIWCLIFLALLIRKRSFFDSVFSYFLWHYSAIGFVRGLFRKVGEPDKRIESTARIHKPNIV